MKKYALVSLLTIIAQIVLAQGKIDNTAKIDSLQSGIINKLDSVPILGDSSTRAALHKADSIRTGFQSKADSLQLAYRKPINKMDSVSKGLQHKIDSLQKLHLPTYELTAKYKAKLDSVTQAKTQRLTELNQKVEGLKLKATAGLKGINLPPQLQGLVQNLEKSIQGYKIPMVNGKIPNLNVSSGKLPGLQLPSGSLNAGNVKLPGVGSDNPLNNLSKETKELSNATGLISGYGSDVKSIAAGNLGEVKNLDKKVESEAMNLQGMGELKGKSTELDKYKSQMSGRPDSMALTMAKQEATKQFTREAVNHFAGQEVMLKAAMDKMGKYKKKYNEVKSLPICRRSFPTHCMIHLSLKSYSGSNFPDVQPWRVSGGYQSLRRLPIHAALFSRNRMAGAG